MTAHPLQNQVVDVAMFGMSVALLGFVTRMVRDVATGALVGDVSASLLPVPVSSGTSLLPQTQKTDREQADQIIEALQKAVDETKKADSIRRIERILGRIDTEILDREIITGLDDLEDAIAEYKGIERAGLTPEEYQEEKESAFEAIAEAVEGLDLDKEAMEEEASTPPESPPADRQKLRQASLETLDRLIRERKHDAWPVLPTSEARKVVYRDVLAGFSSLSEAREYVAGQPEGNVIFTARGDEISFLLIKIVIEDIDRNPWQSPFRTARPDIGRQPPLMPQLTPTGTCYRDAWRFVIKEGEGKLVHGSVQTAGKRINHAWVETETGYIWEPETGEFMGKDYFYERARPQETARYTAEEAAIMVARTNHLGPWSEQENQQYLKGPLLPATFIPGDDLARIADNYGWWAARQAAALCPRSDVACVEREAKRLYEVVRIRMGHGS